MSEVKPVTGFRTSRGGFFEDKEVAEYVEARQNALEGVQNSLYFTSPMKSEDVIRLVTALAPQFLELIRTDIAHNQFLELKTLEGDDDGTARNPEQDAPKAEAKVTSYERRTGRVSPPSTDTKDKNKNLENAGDKGDT